MRTLAILPLLTTLLFSSLARASDFPVLPDSFGSEHLMSLVEKPGTWTPENMYEHVNGEAELLKRYGAVHLYNAAYEHEDGARLSVDLLDMGEAVNAFGLFRLYAGCDGAEYNISGTTVLSGDFTSYATRGRYFMRIDHDAGEGSVAPNTLLAEFMTVLSAVLPAPGPLPAGVEELEALARKPCEVSYHPEHADYELETGPGYTWIGPDGGTYFIGILPSSREADLQAASLRKMGVPIVMVQGNAVTWSKVRGEADENYLKKVLEKVVEW